MFAVFSSGGKQHRVTEGEVIKLERLTAEPGEEVAPTWSQKVRIIKFKRRKDYMRRQGHRQWFTQLKITGISG